MWDIILARWLWKTYYVLQKKMCRELAVLLMRVHAILDLLQRCTSMQVCSVPQVYSDSWLCSVEASIRRFPIVLAQSFYPQSRLSSEFFHMYILITRPPASHSEAAVHDINPNSCYLSAPMTSNFEAPKVSELR